MEKAPQIRKHFNAFQLIWLLVTLHFVPLPHTSAQEFQNLSKIRPTSNIRNTRTFLKLEILCGITNFSKEEIIYYNSLLDTAEDTINIFKNFGLLNATELRDKNREVEDVLRLQILATFSEDRLKIWNDIDWRIGSTEMRIAIPWKPPEL